MATEEDVDEKRGSSLWNMDKSDNSRLDPVACDTLHLSKIIGFKGAYS
jgi:hypothetical protein